MHVPILYWQQPLSEPHLLHLFLEEYSPGLQTGLDYLVDFEPESTDGVRATFQEPCGFLMEEAMRMPSGTASQ